MLACTAEYQEAFYRADASFSDGLAGSSPTAQGAPVSLGEAEGDVNATSIAVSGTTGSICRALGLFMPKLFDMKDRAYFNELIQNAPPIKKTKQAGL